MSKTRRRVDIDEVLPEWQFRSFPVYFGFACGAFSALILAIALPFGWVLTASIFGISFGFAHISTYWWRRRQIERLQQRRDEDERERTALAAREAALSGVQPAAAAPRRPRRRRSARNE